MYWATKKVKFKIEVPVDDIVIEEFRDEFRSLPRFKWYGRREAVLFCSTNQVNYNEALEWIEASIQYERRFENLIEKADFLKKIKNEDAYRKTLAKAKELGTYQSFDKYGWEKLNHYSNPEQANEEWKLLNAIYPDVT